MGWALDISSYNDLIYGVSPADVRIDATYLRSGRYTAVVAGPPNAG